MSQVRTNSLVPIGGIPAGASGGGIIQVVQTVKTDTFSRTSSSSDYGDITGLTATITPRSTSNKVLIIARVAGGTTTALDRIGIRLTAAGSPITGYVGDAASSRTRGISSGATSGQNDVLELTATHLHSPSTTSSITYAVQGSAEGSKVFFCNRGGADTDNNTVYRACSSIILLEVSG